MENFDLCLLDYPQHTPEWYAARLSIPTASGFNRIVRPDGRPSGGALKYRVELIANYIRNAPKTNISTQDTERGLLMEPVARAEYVLQTGHRVIEVGGVFMDRRRTVMASPDGLMPERRWGLEIKCPQLETHILYCMERTLPDKYAMQVHGGILVTDYEGWDFVSYCPEYTPQPLLIIPVNRDETLLAKMRREISNFSSTLEAHKRIVDEANAKVEAEAAMAPM